MILEQCVKVLTCLHHATLVFVDQDWSQDPKIAPMKVLLATLVLNFLLFDIILVVHHRGPEVRMQLDLFVVRFFLARRRILLRFLFFSNLKLVEQALLVLRLKSQLELSLALKKLILRTVIIIVSLLAPLGRHLFSSIG